jgi:surfeit locus 1 family protein
MTRHPAFWPTFFAVPAFLVLLGLGTWQVERLHWKEGLIAQRHAAVTAPAIDLPKTLEEAKPLEFRHVRASGTFLHDKELFIGATADSGTVGYHVMTPLRRADGLYLLVNRGFVPSEMKDPGKRAAGEVPGEVTVEGLLRLPPPGKPAWYIPDNSPARNYWFYVDPKAMAEAAGVPALLPFYVDAGPAPNPGGWPRGATTLLELPNNHLQYAITWYAIAAGLAGVYVLFIKQRIAEHDALRQA